MSKSLGCFCFLSLLLSASTNAEEQGGKATEVVEQMGNEATKNNEENITTADSENTIKKSEKSTIENEDASLEPVKEEPTAEAPAYKKLLPIVGWNRHMGDAARSIRQWKRWVSYLRMKKPIVMKWIDGLVLRIYPGNEVFRALYVRGIYDPNLNVVVNALLPRGGVFIDAGANMGYFSLLASRKIGDEGRIFAIEPSSRDFIRLVDNVNINNLNDVVANYRLAFTDRIGKANITIASEERSGLNTIGAEFGTKGVEKVCTEEVDTTTVDAFVESEKIKDLHVLKLDIEGSEGSALAGARNTIQKFRPAVMLGIKKSALEACGSGFEQLTRELGDLKYVAYKIVQDPDNFRLEKVDDLSKAEVNVVFCLHESIVPPQLPQPEKKSFMDYVRDFFTM